MFDSQAMRDPIQIGSARTMTTDKIYLSVVIFASLLFFAFSISSPDQNWDILGYSASAISLENNDPAFIHNYIYGELQNYGTESERKKLMAGSDYAATMHNDANAFFQQIPYYKIRIIFVGLIYLFVTFGINIFTAGHIIAAAAASLGLIVYFYGFKDYIKSNFWIMIPFFYVLLGIFNAAQYVTADTLAFLWIGLISVAFIRKHWTVYPLIALSVLMRTDLAVLVAIMLSYIFFFWPNSRLKASITAVLAGILYLSVNDFVGNYGWSTVFYYVFISNMTATHPEQFSQFGISFQLYAYHVVSNLIWIFYESEFWLFIVFIFTQYLMFFHLTNSCSSYIEKIGKYLKDPIISLTLISATYVAIHYLLFPAMWTRFFLGQYMIGALGLLYTITLFIHKIESNNESL